MSASSVYVLIWMLPSLLVSILVGGYVGYSFALRRHGDQIRDERRKTLEALHEVVQSAQALETEVDTHNTQLESVGRTVEDIATSGSYELVKETLLQQITSAIESNRKLNQDLVCTRYRLEEQALELDRTRQEARLDALSGVGNRKAFDEALQYMCAKFTRHRQAFGLLLIDIDHFKWINDTHGHQSGDVVVARLGEVFKGTIRPGDHIARYGGDEFAVLLEGVNLETGQAVAQRIRGRVEQINLDVGVNDAHVAITLSMGLAVIQPGDTAASLVSKADQALYRAKQNGRNRLMLYEETEIQQTQLAEA